jgi:CheY-like chemotaxis protein/nitrogen-specific signal transduction histidine kinase
VTTERPDPPSDLRSELEREREALKLAVAEAEELRRTVESLEDSVRARDTILSVVAHDLRNPLNVILLAANSLLQRQPSSSMRRPVERIVRSADRAQRMVGDLLAISALETGQFELEVKPVAVSNLIFAALESQQGVAAEASLILSADLSPDLPAIEGDEERLLEVLENLVSNAIKFTAAGGSITVGASAREQSVVIWVRDSGCGIAPEQMPHIFDRFWQAKKKERRGIGLGLSICKGIVEAHEGRIWAESTKGAGTTMFFTVPASAQPLSSPEKPQAANILLIDDRPENLTALRAILDRPDYNLVTASSGKKALEMVLKHRFSVALLDIAMPGMNGFEVATHMKELQRSRDIPIIFVTAFGNDPEEIHRAYAAGGADYLVKPLDPEIVRKKVAVFVELARR